MRFRDIFLANWLTSMPRIGVDVYAASFIYLTGEKDHGLADGLVISLILLVAPLVAFFLDGKTRSARCNDLGLFVVPLLCALPLWFRIAQSFKKYAVLLPFARPHACCLPLSQDVCGGER